MVRIVTFNVNGLRSIREYYRVSKGWSSDQFLDSLQGDILCFQEHKINELGKLDREFALPSAFTGYYSFLRIPKRIGYSGVVTFCQSDWRPLAYEEGFTGAYDSNHVISPILPKDFDITTESLIEPSSGVTREVLDGEGRCMITDHGHFVLLNVYFPNDSGPERLSYRIQFYSGVFDRCRLFLESGRSIIVTGDLNVSSHPQDHCDYAPAYGRLVERYGQEAVELFLDNSKESGHIDTSLADALLVRSFHTDKPLRRWYYDLLWHSELHRKFNLRDAFRSLHPRQTKEYTCWNTMVGARGTNHGTRIDAFLVAGPLFQEEGIIKECRIMAPFMGSDHCPVILILDLPVYPIKEPALPRNLAVHVKQKRLSDFFSQPKIDDETKTDMPSIATASTSQEAGFNGKRLKTVSGLKLTDFFPLRESDTLKDTIEDVEPSNNPNQWQSIFKSPPPPPPCQGHNEPCKLLTVNKRGPNQGRKFYVCSRGMGTKDNPDARCSHFEWYHKDKRGR